MRSHRRVLLLAALVAATGLVDPATALPTCTPGAVADRCPVQQTEIRGDTATASALAVDSSRGIAVATGWTAQDGGQTPTTVGVRLATGEQLWRHTARPRAQDGRWGGAVYDVATNALTGRTFVGGHAYVAGDRAAAVVHALDTSTGREIWSVRSPGPVSAYVDSTQRVLVAPDGRTVYAFGTASLPSTAAGGHRYTWRAVAHDAATGRLRWIWTLPDGGDQSAVSDAALAGGSLVVTGYTQRLDAPVVVLDAHTGRVRWRAEAPPGGYGQGEIAVDVARRLVVTAHATWVGEGDAPLTVVARRLGDGAVRWTAVVTAPGEDLTVSAMTAVEGRFVLAGAGRPRGEGLTPNDGPPAVPLLAAYDAGGRQSWLRRPSEHSSATATGLTAGGGRLYAYGEQDQRPGLPHVAPPGAALLWRVDPATGGVLWTGRTRGRGDQAYSQVGEETVGAAVVGSDLVALVRHQDLHYGLHRDGAAMLVQRWAG